MRMDKVPEEKTSSIEYTNSDIMKKSYISGSKTGSKMENSKDIRLNLEQIIKDT